MTPEQAYLSDMKARFAEIKRLAEAAIAQVRDDELAVTLDPESNSLATIMKHMAGNLRSRFTDFLTTDGEKPDRNRDGEFELDGEPGRSAILDHWNAGWTILFQALDALQPGDLLRDVYIRGECHSVIQALNRQLAHHASHGGQIVFLAKHLRSSEWESLSIPRRRRSP